MGRRAEAGGSLRLGAGRRLGALHRSAKEHYCQLLTGQWALPLKNKVNFFFLKMSFRSSFFILKVSNCKH